MYLQQDSYIPTYFARPCPTRNEFKIISGKCKPLIPNKGLKLYVLKEVELPLHKTVSKVFQRAAIATIQTDLTKLFQQCFFKLHYKEHCQDWVVHFCLGSVLGNVTGQLYIKFTSTEQGMATCHPRLGPLPKAHVLVLLSLQVTNPSSASERRQCNREDCRGDG